MKLHLELSFEFTMNFPSKRRCTHSAELIKKRLYCIGTQC